MRWYHSTVKTNMVPQICGMYFALYVFHNTLSLKIRNTIWFCAILSNKKYHNRQLKITHHTAKELSFAETTLPKSQVLPIFFSKGFLLGPLQTLASVPSLIRLHNILSTFLPTMMAISQWMSRPVWTFY